MLSARRQAAPRPAHPRTQRRVVPHRSAASLDRSRRPISAGLGQNWPPRILATVGRETGPLVGIDGIRIDAAVGSLRSMTRLRSRYLCPALLDLPGAGSGPVSSPLTTSEFLVFASAERFDWVSLRGVTRAETTRRARALLHPTIRLAANVSVPALLDESLHEICAAADALILDRSALMQYAGRARAVELLQRACERAAAAGLPCMILGGLSSPAADESLPTQYDVDDCGSLLAAGASHFILDAGTRHGVRSQAAVDALRLVVHSTSSRERQVPTPPRSARLAGRQTLRPRRAPRGH